MNRTLIVQLLGVVLLAGAFQNAALARDDRQRHSITEALSRADFQAKLGDVQLFWGDQNTPGVVRAFGEFTSNKKTNAFNKSDREACEWAFLSAVLALQQRALREGGNAVVGINSVYKNGEFSSRSEFECGAGKFVAGVALRGRVVQLK